MVRPVVLLGLAVSCIAGCCSPPEERQFVLTSTVVRVEPQPTTRAEYQDAEQQGYLIAATGLGVAFGVGDESVQMQPGEVLHVLRIDPRTGEVLVRRLDYHTLARLSPEGLEVRGTTYSR